MLNGDPFAKNESDPFMCKAFLHFSFLAYNVPLNL